LFINKKIIMSSTNIKKFVISPLASGAVCGGLVYLVYGNNDTLPFMGMEMSSAATLAATAAVSDITGTLITDAISDVNTVKELDEVQKMALKPLISGAMMVGVSRVFIASSSPSAMMKIAGMGALSNVGGSYLSDMVSSTM
jgi:hypothetical protein